MRSGMRARARRRGVTLLEVLVYIGILGLTLGLLQKVLTRRYESTQLSMRADARLRAASRLEAQLRSDIAGSRQAASADGGLLTLTRFDGAEVRWNSVDGMLVRSEGRTTEQTVWRVVERSATVDASGLVRVEWVLTRIDPLDDPEVRLRVDELLGGRR